MVIRVIAILAAAFLFTGCGKKAQAPAPVSPPAQPVVQQPAAGQNNETTIPTGIENQGAQVSAATPAGETNAAVSVPAANLADLHFAVRGWNRSHGHWPKSFEEFASDPPPGVVIPPPPPGKKYAFDAKYNVNLVNK